MAKVEICLQASDAEALAAELAGQVGQGGVQTERLATRGLEIVTLITITAATVATANILMQWVTAVRARRQRINCTVKIDGRPVEVEMPRAQFLKLFK